MVLALLAGWAVASVLAAWGWSRFMRATSPAALPGGNGNGSGDSVQ